MASQAPVPEIRFTEPRPSSPPLRFSSSPDSAAHLPPSPPPSLLSATSPSPIAPADFMIDEIRASGDDNASNQERPSSPIVLQPSEASREVSLQESTAQGQGKKKGSWLRRRREPLLGSWNPTLTLQNSGSVARDHLASERTFLAYVRTSLTISSTGVGQYSPTPYTLRVQPAKNFLTPLPFFLILIRISTNMCVNIVIFIPSSARSAVYNRRYLE
ncbi:hypothetical protein NLI96_g7959 [Meripilus lineatus]|uniref:DUF202 domain-containing protein n=1 Tax=Meripilus lineatus TaxID=2056292 RepID=A0AAD5UY68_9APHY|nr:hypothetical protein NLI96_g7959 [Physisporinus lineatus]